MDFDPAEALFFPNGDGWRIWLDENRSSSRGVFVRIHKTGSPRAGLRYDEAVEEALCFGWIDSVMKSIDEDHFMLRFTPRKKGSYWATSNLARMKRLIKEGRMTPAGMATLEVPFEDLPDKATRPPKAVMVPEIVENGLKEDPRAWEHFEDYAPSHKRMVIAWIMDAKKDGTRLRRIAKARELFSQGKDL